MTIDIDNLSPELKEFVVDRFLPLQQEVNDLREVVDELREHKRKTTKKLFTELEKLTEAKIAFWESRPHERNDAFTNWELVFWASYVLSPTNRREKLDSITEVAKRGHRIQKIVDFYKEDLKKKNPTVADSLIDLLARRKAKNFLEYVLLAQPILKTKDGEVPMTFWIAVSDWSVNSFNSRVASWMQTHQIEDKPA